MQAATKRLAGNLSPEAIGRLRVRIDSHNGLHADVQPGDRCGLTCMPGVGREPASNGRPRSVIEGADLAAAIFSHWLGENPHGRQFKQALLGKDG